MTTRVEVSVDIARPAAEVFAFVSDFTNNPRWQGGMKRCTITSEPPFGLGSTYDQVAEMAGREIVSSFEVIAYEPDRMVKATTTESTFPITFTRTVEPTTDGCRVSALIEGDATGIFRWLAPLMPIMVRRSIARDYATLKGLLEADLRGT